MKREHLSPDFEPALHGDQAYAPDPSEQCAAPLSRRSEIDSIRDSIANEPHMETAGDHTDFRSWLDRKRAECSWFGTLGWTLTAGIVAGPFALMGAMMTGQTGWAQLVYIILFGPIVEELLKQSGMIYLLERRPYRVVGTWQFVLAACLSALIFASIENLMYVHQFAATYKEPAQLATFSAFRWKVCTALHISCSIIASLGLVRVWKHLARTGAPADLGLAFPLFITAIAVHGLYNLVALFLSDLFG